MGYNKKNIPILIRQLKIMKTNKGQVKGLKFYRRKITGFLLIIVSAFLWSCDSKEEVLPSSTDESDEMTTVEDTTVLNAPIIQTPSPLIHLSDNLDEQDQLGWCIDTRGNGFNSVLHAHSCKASGGDVQFIYNDESFQICSAEFADFCIEMSGGPVEGMNLNLVESELDSPEQRFLYDVDSGEFRPELDTNLCLAVGPTSAPAGIYMSRTLTLELSSETDQRLKKWLIVE